MWKKCNNCPDKKGKYLVENISDNNDKGNNDNKQYYCSKCAVLWA